MEIHFVRPNFSGSLRQKEDGTAVLYWTDYVINWWEEVFPSIEIGMMRLAVLLAAGEENGEFFTGNTKVFTVRARRFIKNNLA
jgi:hypothetical protein